MLKPEVKLVCFDLGGVLVQLARDGWRGACERAGIALPYHDPVAWESHAKVLRDFEMGMFDEHAYIRKIPECLPHIPTDHVLAAFDAWLIDTYQGVESMIGELKERRVPTAILSNTNARHWRAILDEPRFKPVLRIEKLLTSYELGCAKPHLEIYWKAEKQLGVPGEQILFFDDRLENVEGARSAGWQSEQVTNVDDAVSQVREYLKEYRVI